MQVLKFWNTSKQKLYKPDYRLIAKCASSTKAFVTTPIYYVNAAPHIGHLYSTVLADTIRRNYILHGKDVIMSTGTDEHGLKIQQAANKRNMEPIEFCNQVSESFKTLCKAANVEYTSFERTTNKHHKEAVKALWNKLLLNGYFYKGKHEGWYSISDEAFYTNSQVQEVIDEKTGQKIMVSIETGQPVEWTSEENFKFRLSAFRDRLLEWIEKNPTVIVPSNRRNEVISLLKLGLSDLSVSRLRSRLQWGIKVPNESEHTIYVWLDALTNYLTATGYPWLKDIKNKDAFPPDVQVIGKDIIRFHAIYWPAFLMAAELPLPKQILAHAHWTMGKQKMSKSRGNVVNPFQIIKKYGADAVRYYLVRDGGLADDGDYSEEMIQTRYKKDLIGQFDTMIHNQILETANNFNNAFEDREFSKAYSYVFDMISQANKYFSDNEPWRLAKNPEDKERLDTILFYSLEACRVAGILLQPVMPSKMACVLTRLGVSSDKRYFKDATQFDLTKRPLGETDSVLFPKLTMT
ncbi:tRNA synthetases class I (M)-domain-containing protein [Cokeromyces recurvatus]|uniref:tRNA synthetases class I (M)-domain-containing protein n=1 Tax=Cokeromyces recurvatus TaxID=90255 RepID=UPI00221EEDC3|nr:tRNA synthetases class I (M)-domain-containing protein [Cokeromyces recurvatus]KAI7901075.1 tRNA synthetases class I (M)-domain-containing protein [Cokeromyces recurvatus]